ncbi:MAG: hypothetical protein JRE23_05895 [Deltaproteobacteria bacterium]|nr:hypothetical protein [Deltaproteobacteria bacterium]
MNSFADNLQNLIKRSGLDRRKGKMPIFSKYWLAGRRTAPRREEDRQGFYRIDRHSGRTLTAILIIIALSILDALLTLHLTSHGAQEINPVMAYFLNHGPLHFFGAKYLLTCASVIILLLYKNAYLFKTKVRAKILFIVFAIPFALVVQWEVYLIFFVL